jgi:hypothetical protein
VCSSLCVYLGPWLDYVAWARAQGRVEEARAIAKRAAHAVNDTPEVQWGHTHACARTCSDKTQDDDEDHSQSRRKHGMLMSLYSCHVLPVVVATNSGGVGGLCGGGA